MNLRISLSILAAVALVGCSGNVLVLKDELKDESKPLGLNWDRADWRFCEAPECAKSTPKTVVLVAPRQILEPTDLVPKKSLVAVKKTRTISVPFNFSSATVSPEAERLLRQEVAQWHALDSIVVEGRTDDLGSQLFNDRLARKRADAVVSLLKHLRVSGEIELHSQGKCCYATTNRSESSRAKNRRVDLQISTTQKE